MSNELAIRQQTFTLQTMDEVERAAKAMTASGFFQDTKQAAQAVVKILAGQELGFGPFASMTGVHIIQNKPTLAANLLAAAVKRNGKYNYRVIEHTESVCELAFFEGGQEVGRSRFTMDDANKAGVTNKDNWKKFPRNMLFARALSNGQKWFAPDVFNGATVYTPEEMGADVDDEGNVIPGTVEALPVESVLPAPMKKELPRNNAIIWTVAQRQYLIDEHLADNDFAAKGMLGLSNLPQDAVHSDIVAWGKLYRARRSEIDLETTKAYTAQQAAEWANNGGK